MKLLFIHQNFPGQYLHLAPAMARKGHQVRALGLRQPPAALTGVQAAAYKIQRRPLTDQHPLLRDNESKVLRAEAIAMACQQMARDGYQPDVICVHPGWGESLFLRGIWPEVPQLHFVEFYYAGLDVNFDPEFPLPKLEQYSRQVVKNQPLLVALHDMQAGVCPTRWQLAPVPQIFHDRISVIHDGIDTRRASPQSGARFRAKTHQGLALDFGQDDEVVSFVSRSLEPYRGYHRFMRALPRLMRLRPNAQVVIVGADNDGYGAPAEPGTTYRRRFLDEVAPQLPPDAMLRIHFVGRLPHASLMNLFQTTRAHVYLTYPFVLSWSMLEAMACGAVVIGSDTPPVREVIEHGHNGFLVDFFDADALADRISDCLAHRAGSTPQALAARETVLQRYDLETVCLPQHMALVSSMADRRP